MIALVAGVIALSIAAAVMLWVAGSGSTGTGVAPVCDTASQVAMKVFDGTITSSPGANPVAEEDEPQRVEAAADADGVAGPAVLGELLLERGDLRAEDVLPGGHDASRRLVQLLLQLP